MCQSSAGREPTSLNSLARTSFFLSQGKFLRSPLKTIKSELLVKQLSMHSNELKRVLEEFVAS